LDNGIQRGKVLINATLLRNVDPLFNDLGPLGCLQVDLFQNGGMDNIGLSVKLLNEQHT
jgi:hypothetical protein